MRIAFDDIQREPVSGRRLSKRMAALLAVAAGVSLTWLVLTKSLPVALAEKHPDLAYWLHPSNPAALITLAHRARSDLLAHTPPPENGPNESNQAEAAAHGGGTAKSATEHDATDAALRDRVEALALAVIAVDPLNARAFRLLGELAEAPDRKRFHMRQAADRSRREAVALFWLMADSFERNDFQGVIEKADILLRTNATLAAETLRYLATLADSPEARPGLVSALSQQPAWRRRFFEALPRNVQFAGTPFELFISLNEAGTPVTISEAAPYLDVLMQENMAAYAHDIWLQLAIDRDRDTVPLLNNAGFSSQPSGLLFDWALRRGSNSTVEFRPLADGPEKAVWFTFENARVQFPELSQVLVLNPGRYQLRGELRGSIKAARGLRWEVGCFKGKVLAQTDMLFGGPKDAWGSFALDISVPDGGDCKAQQLRLYHNARSPSEQMISGQIAFRHLTLTAIDRDGSL